MNEIMSYLLEWTLRQCQGGEGALYPAHQVSPEVYDRAVSAVGLVVPLSVWLLAVFAVAVLIFSISRIMKGGKA